MPDFQNYSAVFPVLPSTTLTVSCKIVKSTIPQTVLLDLTGVNALSVTLPTPPTKLAGVTLTTAERQDMLDGIGQEFVRWMGRTANGRFP